ncbi:hypothetical protein BKA57DRAFT_509557 [Linnemannia elongata]|nr:hypothetical protein BKA57DRAFT_509557 [Linnemannia elongata]
MSVGFLLSAALNRCIKASRSKPLIKIKAAQTKDALHMPPSFSIVESALAFQLDQPTNVSKTSVYSGSSRPLSSRSRHPSPSTAPANRQNTSYKEDDRGSATGVSA